MLLQDKIVKNKFYKYSGTILKIKKVVKNMNDTIRKYEKRNLIPSGKKFSETCDGYKNWRYYEKQDVYDMVAFFNGRAPGRPSRSKPVNVKVIRMSQKIKLKRR